MDSVLAEPFELNVLANPAVDFQKLVSRAGL